MPDTKPVWPLSIGFCLFPVTLVVPVGISSVFFLFISYSWPPACLMPVMILSNSVLPRLKSFSHVSIGYVPCVLHKIFCIWNLTRAPRSLVALLPKSLLGSGMWSRIHRLSMSTALGCAGSTISTGVNGSGMEVLILMKSAGLTLVLMRAKL